MGSTVIINQTTKPLEMKIGKYRIFTNFATVEKDASYTLHVDYSDTYLEYSLATDTAGKPIIVSSDECVDNKTIIIREVDGKFNVKMEPRVMKSTSITFEPIQKKSGLREMAKDIVKWRFWL